MRQRIPLLMAALAVASACRPGGPPPPDIDGLIAKLKNPDASVSGPAGGALRDIGEPAVAALAVALTDPDPKARESVATVLWGLGPKAGAAVPALAVALQDSEVSVRQAAAMALETIGPAAKDAVPELIKAVHDPEPAVRVRAVVALGKIGPEARAAVPQLTGVLKNEALRKAAEDALRAIQRPQ